MGYKEEFEEWLETRPQIIQDMAKKFPPGDYLVKEDAPYGITASGCTVNLQSYREDGTVGVVIKGKDKSEAALEHERNLGARYNKTAEEMEHLHKQDVFAHVDPDWLELVKNELE